MMSTVNPVASDMHYIIVSDFKQYINWDFIIFHDYRYMVAYKLFLTIPKWVAILYIYTHVWSVADQ